MDVRNLHRVLAVDLFVEVDSVGGGAHGALFVCLRAVDQAFLYAGGCIVVVAGV